MPVTAGSVVNDDSDDFSVVLREIGFGRMASTRAKLANSAETRSFLKVGLDLLREDLIEHTGPDFDHGSRSRLFESISRERILKRASEVDGAKQQILSSNMFRHRWERKDRYTEDLISYMFRLAPQRKHLDEMDAASIEMVRQLSLEELVKSLAKVELDTMLNDPLAGLQAIVQSALPNHPRVREFCRAQLDQLLPRWAQLYERISTAYGLRLRSNLTWLDVAVMFNAVIEGELVWARVATPPTLSNGDGVLASAILAMLPSLVEASSTDWATVYAN